MAIFDSPSTGSDRTGLKLWATHVDPADTAHFGHYFSIVGLIDDSSGETIYRYASGADIGKPYTPRSDIAIRDEPISVTLGVRNIAVGDAPIAIADYPAHGQSCRFSIVSNGTAISVNATISNKLSEGKTIYIPSAEERPTLSKATYLISNADSRPMPVGTVFEAGTADQAKNVTFRLLSDAEITALTAVQQTKAWSDISKDYTVSEIDEAGGYYGYLGMDGKWFIKRVTSTDVRFAVGKNGISEPWKDRTSKNYQRFNEVNWNGF